MGKRLWKGKGFVRFDEEKHRIADTCGAQYDFLPYRRKYTDLSTNELHQLIQDAREYHWQALDLSCCGLSELPDELWSLSDLKLLYIGNRTCVIDGHCSFNRFSSLSRKIENLKNLRVLSLFGITVTVEGDEPLQLNHLMHLELYGGIYETYPKAFAISTLKEVNAGSFEYLPNYFCNLSKLETLYLSGCSFSILPDWFGELSELKCLSLYGCQIERIPISMRNLHKIERLSIRNTPLESKVPDKILNQSAQEIIRYILDMQEDTPREYFNESKMIIVGQPQVGKSSLAERLVYGTYTPKNTTEGIDIKLWRFTHDGEDYRLNLWDFGGQEIYHSTHQFFLTERCLYILVWDAISENEYGRIDYWLRTIQSFSDDSPILIVVNKCDSNIGRYRRINFEEYKGRYPQIKGIYEVSCKDNYGIDHLREEIQKTAVSLPLMKTPWFTAWLNVRRELEEKAETNNHIRYEEYLRICRDQGLDNQQAESLAKYLHDLGVILYYHKDILLKDLIILSSEWGTDAVYKILDQQERHLKGRNGILCPSKDLKEIWTDEERYPRKYHPHLLNLMENFQLSFKINFDTYLVADLLGEKSINLNWQFKFGETLKFRLNYDFMPAGIMTRFIVAANEMVEIIDGVYQCWKKGAYLRRKSAYALVQLFDAPTDRYVSIQVSGLPDQPREKQELMTIIRDKLEKINAMFKKITITQMIPCSCSSDCSFFFNYDNLRRADSMQVREMQCHNTFKTISVRKLLDGVEPIMKNVHDEYSVYINNSPIFNNQPQITNTNTNTSTNTNTNTISIEIQNEINGFHGDINRLRRKVNDPEFTEECEEIFDALNELDQCQTEKDLVRSGILDDIKDFVEKCIDPESKTGKILAATRNAVDIAKDLGKKYNRIASRLSLPSIPLIGT